MTAVRQSTPPIPADKFWLDIFPYGNIIKYVRATDYRRRIQRHRQARRREIIELLARSGALSCGALRGRVELSQASVSKHLGVLRKVGVVSVIKRGKQRVYHLEAEKLKTVHDWVKAFEELWGHRLDRIKDAC